jgi:tRNA pseudouridine 55 synthase
MNKEPGVTSFRSLSDAKHYFKGEKVGHAGTLDKFAEGLMLVLVGKATKLNPLFSSLDKTYVASVRFGLETDTLDPEGETVKTGPLPTAEEIEAVLPSFLGEQNQIPPLYSALHVDGKRAYQIARSGASVEMKSRKINIYSIKFLSFDGAIAQIELRVSKGTYIRSFARDLGERLGTAASLCALKRTSIGPYTLDDVSSFDTATEKTVEVLLKMENIRTLDLRPETLKLVRNGYLPKGFFIGSVDADGYYLGMVDGRCIVILSRENGAFDIVAQYGDADGSV